MALEISGKIVKILAEQSGTGKNGVWKKQDFVIETAEQFPKKVCISAWGDKVDQLQSLSEGEEVRVAINVESREYNDRWYTDVKAWKIETGSGGGSVAPKSNNYKKAETQNGASEITTFHADADGEDDLPF